MDVGGEIRSDALSLKCIPAYHKVSRHEGDVQTWSAMYIRHHVRTTRTVGNCMIIRYMLHAHIYWHMSVPLKKKKKRKKKQLWIYLIQK